MDGLFIGVFMQLRFFLFASIATLFLGCSSISMPKARVVEHDAERTIPAIDEMIVEMKQDYITKCYAPVVKRDPPENSCQTELFQMLERRYHTNYSQNHVSMASNDLFFRDVEVQLKKWFAPIQTFEMQLKMVLLEVLTKCFPTTREVCI